MSFPRIDLQYIFASKTPYYARYTNINIRPHHPWRPRLRSFHLQDVRSLQGGAQHRANHHQRQDEVHPMGRRQSDTVQHHRSHRV